MDSCTWEAGEPCGDALIAAASFLGTFIAAQASAWLVKRLVIASIEQANAVTGALYEGAQLAWATYGDFSNVASDELKAFVCDVSRAIAVERVNSNETQGNQPAL